MYNTEKHQKRKLIGGDSHPHVGLAGISQRRESSAAKRSRPTTAIRRDVPCASMDGWRCDPRPAVRRPNPYDAARPPWRARHMRWNNRWIPSQPAANPPFVSVPPNRTHVSTAVHHPDCRATTNPVSPGTHPRIQPPSRRLSPRDGSVQCHGDGAGAGWVGLTPRVWHRGHGRSPGVRMRRDGAGRREDH
jgi:hypothetical protein